MKKKLRQYQADNIRDVFNEFKKLNPHKSVDPFNKYWWPKDKDRSPFFEKIIEETQPKKRK